MLLQLLEVRGHEAAGPGHARTLSRGRRGCGAVHGAGQREAAPRPRPRLGDVQHRRVGWGRGRGGRGRGSSGAGAGVSGGRGGS